MTQALRNRNLPPPSPSPSRVPSRVVAEECLKSGQGPGDGLLRFDIGEICQQLLPACQPREPTGIFAQTVARSENGGCNPERIALLRIHATCSDIVVV